MRTFNLAWKGECSGWLSFWHIQATSVWWWDPIAGIIIIFHWGTLESLQSTSTASAAIFRSAAVISHKISINDQKNQYFKKKICILPNFREKNLYFAKFWGRSATSMVFRVEGAICALLTSLSIFSFGLWNLSYKIFLVRFRIEDFALILCMLRCNLAPPF